MLLKEQARSGLHFRQKVDQSPNQASLTRGCALSSINQGHPDHFAAKDFDLLAA